MWGVGDVDKHPVMSLWDTEVSTLHPGKFTQQHKGQDYLNSQSTPAANSVHTLPYFSFSINHLTDSKPAEDDSTAYSEI